jgi:hypothetical protein
VISLRGGVTDALDISELGVPELREPRSLLTLGGVTDVFDISELGVPEFRDPRALLTL